MNSLFSGAISAPEDSIVVHVESGRVHVPDPSFAFRGDYAKEGQDLIIENDDGQILRVVDYFTYAFPPELVAPNGGVVRGADAQRLAGVSDDMHLAQAQGAGVQLAERTLENAIGQVEAFDGQVTVTRSDGSTVALGDGDLVFQNDVVATGPDSSLSLTFVDGTIFSLSASSRMILDELIYDPGGDDNSAVFNLVEGAFIFITGAVAPSGGMDIQTPAGVIGIRGTTVEVQILATDGVAEVLMSLLLDTDGSSGEVELFDLDGNLIAVVTNTDTSWIISPVEGETREVPRAAADQANDPVLQAQAIAALQSANARVANGDTYVSQERTSGGGNPGDQVLPDTPVAPGETPEEENGGSEDGGGQGGSEETQGEEGAPEAPGDPDMPEQQLETLEPEDGVEDENVEEGSLQQLQGAPTDGPTTIQTAQAEAAQPGGSEPVANAPQPDQTAQTEQAEGVLGETVVQGGLQQPADTGLADTGAENDTATGAGEASIVPQVTQIQLDSVPTDGSVNTAEAISDPGIIGVKPGDLSESGTIETGQLDPDKLNVTQDTGGVETVNLGQDGVIQLGQETEPSFAGGTTGVTDEGSSLPQGSLQTGTFAQNGPTFASLDGNNPNDETLGGTASLDLSAFASTTGVTSEQGLGNTSSTEDLSESVADLQEPLPASTSAPESFSNAQDTSDAAPPENETSENDAPSENEEPESQDPTSSNSAPQITSSLTATVEENQTTALDVEALDDVDAEGSGLSYALTGGADQGLFTIDSATGVVGFASAPDFEAPGDANTDNVYEVEVTVSDSGTLSDSQLLTITVTGVNEDPVITSGASASVAENTTSVVTVTADDEDGDTASFAITGGADAGLFQIDAVSGALSFASAPDFEAPGDANTDNIYAVEVTAADGAGGTDVQSLAVTVTDVVENGSPQITSSLTATVEENQTTALDVEALDDVDAEGSGLSYALTGGADQGLFTIDSATGVVGFASAPDFEAPGDANTDNVYEVEVTVSDSGTLSDSQLLTITVTGVNEDPVITSGASASVAENTTSVVTVTADDEDGDTASFAITGGADAGLFQIDAVSGALSFASAPDFEAPGDANTDNIYAVEVTAADGAGGTDVQSLAVTVTDVVENGSPQITSSLTATVEENQTTALDVEALDDVDAEGSGLSYALTGGADQGLFTIDSATGVVGFASAPDFEAPGDANTDNVYEVEVTVSDSGTLSDSQLLTITVTGVNEDPVITSGASASVAENTTSVVTVTADDEDGDTASFAITGGADAGLFQIDAVSGALSFASAPDFEAPGDANTDNIYAVEVTAADGAGGTDVQSLAVTVTDVVENGSPQITSSLTATVEENQTTALDVEALDDVDAEGSGLSYALTGGADQGLFTIDSATGVVGFASAPDFEAPGDANTDNVYEVEVTVSDSGTLSDSQLLTITVTGVNEDPVITSGASASVAENTTSVVTVTADDEDGDTASFAITGGADAGLFQIDAVSGALSFASAPDFEAPGDANTDNIYAVEVTAADGAGGTDVQSLAVTVTDVVENGSPQITSSLTATVEENQTTALDVEALDDVDAEGSGLSYALTGGADQGLFTIDSATGVVGFASAPDFEAPGDANTDNVYEVEVTVSDSGTLSDSQLLTITVTGVNEDPVITSGASASVAENTTSVVTVTADDEDGDTASFAITGGADAGLFQIDAVSGALSFASAPDFEAPGDANTDNIYAVEVTAADGAGGTDVQSLAVTVTDVVENGSPQITSSLTATVEENQTTALDVEALDDVDAEGSGLSYALTGGADQGLFTIDSATGVVGFASAPDFEAPGDANTDNVYEVEVTVSDSGTLSDSQLLTITVTGVNEDPVITSGASASVAENTTSVVTVTADDEDGDTASFAITGGADAGLFQIDAVSGALSFASAPDFEAPGDANTDNIYAVEVTAADGAGGTDVQSLAVTVTDVVENGSPQITSSLTATVEENQTTALDVEALDDVDAEGSGLSYALTGGADQGLFTIDSATGVVGFASAPDFEAPGDANTDNVYEVEVTVSDSGTLSDSQLLTITVTGVNEDPVITSGASASVAENTTSVVTVTADDEDGDTASFAITGGADAGLFQIDAVSGALSFASAPDFEAPGDANTDNIYAVEVTAADGAGGTDVQSLAVTVTDVVENGSPQITSSLTATVEENQTTALDVEALDDVDAEGSGLSYALTGGADQGLFTIDSATGVVGFASAPDFEAPGDANTDNVYEVEVTVSDSGTLSDSQLLTITVTGVNEDPVITSGASASVAENTTSVVTVTADDEDGDTASFAITGGADAGLFQIDAVSGALSFASAPDFEAPGDANTDNIYAVEVTAADGAGGTDVQSLAVTVTDVVESSSLNITLAGSTSNVDPTIEPGELNISDLPYEALFEEVSPGVFDNRSPNSVSETEVRYLSDSGRTFAFIGQDLNFGAGTGLVTGFQFGSPTDPDFFDATGLLTPVSEINTLIAESLVAGSIDRTPFDSFFGSFDLVINGSPGDDFLDYTDISTGNDTFNGAEGDDYFAGGLGDDSYNGGLGSDVFADWEGSNTFDGGDADDGLDRLDYNGLSSAVDIDLNDNSWTKLTGETDTFSGIEGVTGSGFADIITVSNTAPESYVEGLAGNDTLTGRAGGLDIVSYISDARYTTNTTGVTVSLAAGLATDLFGDQDVLSGFEAVIGSLFGDTLTASDTGSQLSGFGGADSIISGAGDDTLSGGEGADTIVFTAGNDIVTDFVSAEDSLDFSGDALTFVDSLVLNELTGVGVEFNFEDGGSNPFQLFVLGITQAEAEQELIDAGFSGSEVDVGIEDTEVSGTPGDDTFTVVEGAGETFVDRTFFASEGFDTYDLTDSSFTVYNQIDYSGLGLQPIVATIDLGLPTGGATETTSTVNKGLSGTDTIIDVWGTADWGFGIRGTAGNDTVNANQNDSGFTFFLFDSNGGQDVVNYTGSGQGSVLRLNVDEGGGVTADLTTGVITVNDGSGDFVDLNLLGDTSLLNYGFETGAGFDSILGTGNQDRIILGADDGFADGRGGGDDRIRYDRDGVGVGDPVAGRGANIDLGVGLATGYWDGRTFNHTLVNFEEVRGSALNDTIRAADTSARNFLKGNDGDDELFSFSGRDVLEGGDGNDLIDASGGAVDPEGWGDYVRPGLGQDTIIGHQPTWDQGDSADLSYGDIKEAAGITITVGDEGSGTAIGKNGLDVNDNFTLIRYFEGSQGNDTFFGSNGNSYEDIAPLGGADSIVAGSNYLTVKYEYETDYFDGNGERIIVNLLAGTVIDTQGNEDTIVGVDEIRGSQFDDIMSAAGTTQEIKFRGEAGNDSLTGGAGRARFVLGAGADTVVYNGGFNNNVSDFSLADNDRLQFGQTVLDNFGTLRLFRFGDGTLGTFVRFEITEQDEEGIGLTGLTVEEAYEVLQPTFDTFPGVTITDDVGDTEVFGSPGSDAITIEAPIGADRDVNASVGDDVYQYGANADRFFVRFEYETLGPIGIDGDFDLRTRETAGVGPTGDVVSTVTKGLTTSVSQGDDQILNMFENSNFGTMIETTRGDDVVSVTYDNGGQFEWFGIDNPGGIDTVTVSPGRGRFVLELGNDGAVFADLRANDIRAPGRFGEVDGTQFDVTFVDNNPQDVGMTYDIRTRDGNDTVFGTDFDNRFTLQAGDNEADGRDGTDTIRYNSGSYTSGVSVDLRDQDSGGSTVVRGTYRDELFNDTLVSIESVDGSQNFGDEIYGSSQDGRLDGRGGDDLIRTGFGNQSIKLGSGADALIYTAGFDWVDDFNPTEDTFRIGGLALQNVGTLSVFDFTDSNSDTFAGIGFNDPTLGDFDVVFNGLSLAQVQAIADGLGTPGQFIEVDAGVTQVFGTSGDDDVVFLPDAVIFNNGNVFTSDGNDFYDFSQIDNNEFVFLDYNAQVNPITANLDFINQNFTVDKVAGTDTIAGWQYNYILGGVGLVGTSGNDEVNIVTQTTDPFGAYFEFESNGGVDVVNFTGGSGRLSIRVDTFQQTVSSDLSTLTTTGSGFIQSSGGNRVNLNYTGDGVQGSLRINGSDGTDNLIGSALRDDFRARGGNDFIDGGDGDRDRLRYDRDEEFQNDSDPDGFDGVRIIMDEGDGTGITTGVFDGVAFTHDFRNIEEVRGTNRNDEILGNDTNNRLEGRDGNDFLRGFGGDNQLLGDGGDDVLAFDGFGAGSFLDGGADRDSVFFQDSGSFDFRGVNVIDEFNSLEILNLENSAADTITLSLENVIDFTDTADALLDGIFVIRTDTGDAVEFSTAGGAAFTQVDTRQDTDGQNLKVYDYSNGAGDAALVAVEDDVNPVAVA